MNIQAIHERTQSSTFEMVKNNVPYQYEDIDAKTQIRVLDIWPPDPAHPEALFGELVTLTLDDAPEFEALSYTWGAPVFNHQLHLPAGHLFITENLHSALAEMRYARKVRRIWADAICINQKDNTEKGFQVGLMSRIYREAKCVLVWLGVGDEQTETAMEVLHRLAEKMCDFAMPDERAFESLCEQLEDKDGNILLALRDMSYKMYNEKEAAALDVFFTQGWFGRLWIVQEFLLATRLLVINGADTMARPRFQMALFALRCLNTLHLMFGGEGAWSPGLSSKINKVAQLMLQLTGSASSLPFTSLIETYHDRGHANDLDIVYSLLGLSPSNGLELQVNYDLEVEALFTLVAWKHIAKGDLDILRYARHISVHEEGKSMPTWAPDWRLPSRQRIEWEYHATTESQTEVDTDSKDMTIVGIAGTMIDEVVMAVDAYSFDAYNVKHSSNRETLPHVIAKHIRRIQREISTHPGPSSWEKLEDHLAESLVFDEVERGTKYSTDPRIFSPALRLHNFETWISESLQQESFTDFTSLPAEVKLYVISVRTSINNRSFLMTKNGYVGFGPDNSMPGDAIVAFHGARTPSVLRRRHYSTTHEEPRENPDSERNMSGEAQRWGLIGECYLHGFMDNEILEPEFDSQRQMFFLV